MNCFLFNKYVKYIAVIALIINNILIHGNLRKYIHTRSTITFLSLIRLGILHILINKRARLSLPS